MISTNQPEQIKTYCFPDFNPNSNNSYSYLLLTAVEIAKGTILYPYYVVFQVSVIA